MPAEDKRPTQPGQSPQADPDEQGVYDLVVTQAMEHIHGERSRDKVLKQLASGPSPAQAIGKIVAQLGLAAFRSAKSTGKADKLSQDVMLSATKELVEQLLELGQAAGAFQVASPEQAGQIAQQAAMEAVRIYGEELLASGDLDSQAAGHQLQQEIAREQQGMQQTPVAAGVSQAINSPQGGQPPPGNEQGAPAGGQGAPAGGQGIIGGAMA